MIVGIVEKAKRLMEEEGALDKRRRCIVYLAVDVRELLEKLIEVEGITTERGGRYPIAWLIEDLILWVFSDKKRLEQFLDETYEVIE